MKTAQFDFHLPPQLIAQEPLPQRESSRLLVVRREAGTWEDAQFRHLPDLLQPGDTLVLNDTRVIPARLRGARDKTGGKIEILLLPPGATAENQAQPDQNKVRRRVLMRAGGRLEQGETVTLKGGLKVTLIQRLREAGDLVEFACSAAEFDRYVQEQGEVPLPPYIHRPAGPSAPQDRERYQTVFAQVPGAVAAPTAGLHFSGELLKSLTERGISWHTLTLHVGPGTFRPVKADEIEAHFVDAEPFFIPAATVRAVRQAKRAGRRVIAVGTTTLRALEGGLAQSDAPAETDIAGQTALFVYPPYSFRLVDGLLTNFHLPKTSLLMLVSAFAAPEDTTGVELVKRAYEHAVRKEYRFYSYGDACLFL